MAAEAPRRNIELKAVDADPERSLRVCAELGARDRGLLRQRDTYFRAPRGRLKLREEVPDTGPSRAELIQYERPDAAEARESRYQLVEVPHTSGLGEALATALGVLVVVEKERRLFEWESVRIHLDRVAGLGDFVELEGVAEPGSDLTAEAERVELLRDRFGLDPDALLAGSYADRMLSLGEGSAADPRGASAQGSARELLSAARDVLVRAYAPYSGYRVGAALRAPDGSLHVGVNVENAAYPQGQCAEASALGALVAAGHDRVLEAAVVASGPGFAAPCGGCRQRLFELGGPDATVHLADGSGGIRTARLGELLPMAFGPAALAAAPG